ncbi:MAG: hypothetical protein U0325_01360 [Polyangiales bacterium]
MSDDSVLRRNDIGTRDGHRRAAARALSTTSAAGRTSVVEASGAAPPTQRPFGSQVAPSAQSRSATQSLTQRFSAHRAWSPHSD